MSEPRNLPSLTIVWFINGWRVTSVGDPALRDVEPRLEEFQVFSMGDQRDALLRTPTGFHQLAQGCEVRRATLGYS